MEKGGLIALKKIEEEKKHQEKEKEEVEKKKRRGGAPRWRPTPGNPQDSPEHSLKYPQHHLTDHHYMISSLWLEKVSQKAIFYCFASYFY